MRRIINIINEAPNLALDPKLPPRPEKAQCLDFLTHVNSLLSAALGASFRLCLADAKKRGENYFSQVNSTSLLSKSTETKKIAADKGVLKVTAGAWPLLMASSFTRWGDQNMVTIKSDLRCIKQYPETSPRVRGLISDLESRFLDNERSQTMTFIKNIDILGSIMDDVDRAVYALKSRRIPPPEKAENIQSFRKHFEAVNKELETLGTMLRQARINAVKDLKQAGYVVKSGAEYVFTDDATQPLSQGTIRFGKKTSGVFSNASIEDVDEAIFARVVDSAALSPRTVKVVFNHFVNGVQYDYNTVLAPDQAATLNQYQNLLSQYDRAVGSSSKQYIDKAVEFHKWMSRMQMQPANIRLSALWGSLATMPVAFLNNQQVKSILETSTNASIALKNLKDLNTTLATLVQREIQIAENNAKNVAKENYHPDDVSKVSTIYLHSHSNNNVRIADILPKSDEYGSIELMIYFSKGGESTSLAHFRVNGSEKQGEEYILSVTYISGKIGALASSANRGIPVYISIDTVHDIAKGLYPTQKLIDEKGIDATDFDFVSKNGAVPGYASPDGAPPRNFELERKQRESAKGAIESLFLRISKLDNGGKKVAYIRKELDNPAYKDVNPITRVLTIIQDLNLVQPLINKTYTRLQDLVDDPQDPFTQRDFDDLKNNIQRETGYKKLTLLDTILAEYNININYDAKRIASTNPNVGDTYNKPRSPRPQQDSPTKPAITVKKSRKPGSGGTYNM